MFTALYNDTEIDISDYETPKLSLEKSGLRCKFCDESLTIKHGLIKEKHFSHLPDSSCDYERLQGEPESAEHRALKAWVRNWYQSNVTECQVELEKRVCDGKRIADVFVAYPTGFVEVVECQVSMITAELLLERTRDYETYGLECYWILNEAILTHKFFEAIQYEVPYVSTATIHRSSKAPSTIHRSSKAPST